MAGIAQKFSIAAEKAEMNKAPSSGEPGPDVARLKKESPSFWAERTSTAGGTAGPGAELRDCTRLGERTWPRASAFLVPSPDPSELPEHCLNTLRISRDSQGEHEKDAGLLRIEAVCDQPRIGRIDWHEAAASP